MGTLQSELAKIKSLEEMPFDDDSGAVVIEDTPAEVAIAVDALPDESSNPTKTEQVWNFIRLHPRSNLDYVAGRLGMTPIEVYRCVYSMLHRKLLSKEVVNGIKCYSVTGDSFPKLDRKAIMLSAREKRWSKPSDTGTKNKAINNKTKPSLTKEKPATQKTVAPSVGLDANNVGSWPLATARHVYTELNRYFNESNNT